MRLSDTILYRAPALGVVLFEEALRSSDALSLGFLIHPLHRATLFDSSFCSSVTYSGLDVSNERGETQADIPNEYAGSLPTAKYADFCVASSSITTFP